MKRGAAYVDGFNLYFRALKGTPYKWLDVGKLIDLACPDDTSMAYINYYTAHVSARIDHGAPARQQTYLNALRCTGRINFCFGNFLTNKKFAPVARPIDVRPKDLPMDPAIDMVLVWKTEEKGSDVNLASQMVRDAALDRFDVAMILTNDTDLCEAIRIVRSDFSKRVVLLAPGDSASPKLQQVSDATRHIQRFLKAAQLPDPVVTARGKHIYRPREWSLAQPVQDSLNLSGSPASPPGGALAEPA